MDRRDFIKNTTICSSALCLGCSSIAKTSQNNHFSANTFYPTSVKLETCTLCQLSCPECWRVREPHAFPLGYLTFDNFKKFIDMNPFIKSIDLTCYGEMFLNPDLNKILKYGAEKNVKLAAQSGVNLNTISDETAELLVKTKFEDMNISIDGATPQTYSIYRRGGDFNNVIENIKKIQYYQKKYNDFEHPRMVYKFILFGHNEHEIPMAKQLAKELGLPITFSINYEPKYSPIKNYEFVEKETGINFKNVYKEYEDFYYEEEYKKYANAQCTWFFCTTFIEQPYISYDGRLLGCCLYYYDRAKDVNVFDKGLIGAYKTKEIQKILNLIALKDMDATGTYCNDCPILKFLRKNNYKITIDNHNKIKSIVEAKYHG